MLPPELTDIIIDYLHDDRKALARCGRVCKSWVTRSRLYLWRRITIDSTNEVTATLACFLDYIRDSPVVVHNIQYLELSLLDGDLGDKIIAQLPSLPSLKTLSLSMLSVRAVPDGATLSTSVDTLVVSYLSFKTISHWHTFVSAFPNMKTLVFGKSMRVLRRNSRLPGLLPTNCHLQRLELAFSDETSALMYGWLSSAFASLKTLQVELAATCTNPPGLFWSKSLATMENLVVSAWTAPGDAISLDHAERLRTVTVEVKAPELAPFLVRFFRRGLARLPPAAHIRRLLVVLRADESRTTQSLRGAWAAELAVLHLMGIDYGVCESVVVRAEHPLQWDKYLSDGLEHLRRQVPLRMEQKTQDGQIVPFVTPAGEAL